MDKNKDISRSERRRASDRKSLTAAVIFGEDVQEYRKQWGFSQRDLAHLAGTTQAHIAKIEAGQANPTLKTLTRLAAAFAQDLVIGFRSRRQS